MTKRSYAIEIKNVSKTFYIPTEKRETVRSYFLTPFRRLRKKKFHALKNISFKVKKGEFLGIIGRNGSGKSTLLKLIAGIYMPDKGKIKVNGKIVPFLELGVGFNPELSGRENVFLNGTILGMSRKYLEKKFDEIVNFAEVREFIDMPLKNYSSGMQVRLAFSIAIQADADIYLLDEVLAVGDASFQLKCFDVLKRLKKLQKTILYVSHSEESIRRHCTQVVYLADSQVKHFGAVEIAYAKYSGKDMARRQVDISKLDSSKISKVKSNVRWGSGEVIVQDVNIKNSLGKKKNIFKYGQDIIIDIVLKRVITKKLKKLNIGVGIYNNKDHYVLGVNTQMDKIKVNPRTNQIHLRLEKIQLLSDIYYVNIVIFSENEEQPFDWMGRVKEFKIINSPRYRGSVSLKHTWIK